MIRTGNSLVLIGTIAIVSGTSPVLGQALNDTGGTTLTFGISSKLEANDNYGLDPVSPGNSFISDTRLSFGLVKQTQVDTLTVLADGVLRVADLPTGSDARFDDPGFRLGYIREGADSRFNADVEWRRTNLDFLDPFEINDITNPTDLTIATGERQLSRGRLTYETGIDAPLGFLFDLGTEVVDYSGTTDPDLYDLRTDDAAVTARLRFSAVTEGSVRLSQENYSAEDTSRTKRRTRDLTFGLTYALSPIDTIETTLGQSKIRETLRAVPSATTSSGVIGSFGLTRELTNGSAGILLDRSFSVNGSRTTGTMSRALDFPTGQMAASIGLTKGEVGGTEVVGSLDYTRELPRGQITARIDRSVDTASDGDDFTVTQAALGYLLELSQVSNIAFNVDYAETSSAGTSVIEETKLSGIRVIYSHSLTKDWNLLAGYEHVRRNSSVDGKAKSNSIFLILDRDFVFLR